MKPIDESLHAAFAAMRQHCASNAEMATQLGCTPKHVGAILTGRVQFLRDRTWEQLAPILAPYIPYTPDTIPAPADPKRRFVAQNLHLLPDDRIAQLALELIDCGASLG